MLTSKQRAQLRGLAATEDTIVHIGKGGITDNIITQMSDALKARELVKGRVLENSLLSAREACDRLAEVCRAEPVQVIGSKFVLYKRNEQKPKIELVKKGTQMKICIYGGSFNPPHLGHTAALRAVRAAIRPDLTLVIPDRIPPHKELTAGSPEPAERLLMTMMAFAGEPGVEVSDMELHRSGKSYTADTVRELSACNPDAELYLVIGTDMLTTFEQWHDFRYLLAQVTLVALARTGDEHAEVERFSAYLRGTYDARVIALPAEPVPVTSTAVRALLPQRRGSEYLAPNVYAHIIQQRLYGAKPDLNWLREQAYPMLKPRRISHVWGCEHEARHLAERWGCDPDAAAEAGILHDCTKKLELSDQLLLSDKYGIINDTVETANTKLLHAKTGAAVARDRFGVPLEIENAIRWHTTGKPDMTTLEKVLYMADYIEPSRDFDGVDELRRLAYTDLDAAMVLGLKMSLEDLKAGGITPHENTVQALNWYQGREKNMKRRQSDDRYPGDYGGYDDQGYDRYDGGYDDSYDDGSGFQDDPFSEASAAVNHRVQAQQSQAKRKKKKKVRITVIVVVVLALLIGEFAILMNHWVSPPSLSDGDSDDVSVSTDGRKKGCYTFLIAGKDRAAGLTDTVLVGMLDTENQSLKFVSIPRDTAVNVSYKPKKMNQYYAAAENNGRDGVEALIGGAEQILGYRVDSYALFDVEVFVELIDAMGGIDFDVPVDMDYDDPGQDLSIHVQKGYQHLNGYQTMGVFRFRNTYANGDIGRIDVQHQLLKAMTSQFLKLHNIPNLNKLIDIYEKDVTTNLSAGNVMFYVKEFLKLDESAISFETIPANYSGTKNGMSYVFIHVDEWLDYLNTWLNPYTKEITSADVDILYESNGQVVATSGTVQGPNKW